MSYISCSAIQNKKTTLFHFLQKNQRVLSLDLQSITVCQSWQREGLSHPDSSAVGGKNMRGVHLKEM